MKKKKNRLRKRTFMGNYSLKKKLVILYLLLSVVPIILVSTIAYVTYYNSILNQSLTLIEQNARQHEMVVSERLKNYHTFVFDIVIDNDVIALAEQLNDAQSESELLITQGALNSILRNYLHILGDARSITLLTDSSRHSTQTVGFDSVASLIWSDSEKRQEIYTAFSEKSDIEYLTAINLAINPERNEYVIMMGFPIRNMTTREQVGVLVIALDHHILNFDRVSPGVVARETQETGVITVIIDGQNRILSTDNTDYIAEYYMTFLEDKLLRSGRIYESRENIRGTDWQILNIIDLDVYLADINIFIGIVAVLTVLIMIIFYILYFLISKKYVSTITEIVQGIDSFQDSEGNESTVHVDDKDELYIVARQFNRMTKRVNDLVATLKNKIKK